MNLDITKYPDDDYIFIQGLTRLVSEAIRQYNPAEVFLIRIDNWFDEKWFAFAGKAKVGINTGVDAVSSEVRPFWKVRDSVTIPPFVPHRIIEESHMRHAHGILSPAGADFRLVHPSHKKRSSANLDNRLLDHSPSALFIWFSSKSSSNGRASMMLYRTHEQKVGGWYVSFMRDDDWHVNRVRNKNRDLIERLFQPKEEKDATQQPNVGDK